MRDIVIAGAGAALATPLIEHYLRAGDRVTAVYRNTKPKSPPGDLSALRVRRINQFDPAEGVDVLITLTGATDNAKLGEMTDLQWATVVSDCLAAPFDYLRLCLPHLKDGNVVVVGSVVGSMGGRGCANYAAAKAGLIGLVRAAANEYARDSVCVNLLELGYTELGMGAELPEKVKDCALGSIPLRRFATAEDFVLAVDFLSRTRYMTGGVLTLSGGLR